MSKQDRQGVRTPSDLDRRYDLGGLKKAVSAVVDISNEARQIISEVAEDLRQETDEKIAANLEGYAKVSDLNGYAKTSDLDSYAKTADLEGYAEKAELEGYATTEALNGVAQNVSQNTQTLTSQQKTLESTTRIANDASSTAQGIANDVNDHLEFADGGTRIKGSFNAMLLPEGTDLDGVILPNRYIGGNVADYGYLNCPVTTGTFFLSVEPCGDLGQILQRLTYSHKTEGKTFERVFYTDGWGAWICVADYTGAALNEIQEEVNLLGVALGEHVSSFATSMAETGDDIGDLGDRVDALGGRTQSLETTSQALFGDLSAVINEINDHFEFADGGTRIKGVFNAMLLPAGTDLDGVILPNRYVGGNISDFRYLNCPITSGSFFLDVESCGNEGQLLQRLIYAHKTSGKTYERIFAQDGWGQWVVVTDYTGAALQAIQNDIETVEAALNQHKTDVATRVSKVEGNINTISNNVNSLTNSTQTMNTKLQSVTTDLQAVAADINDHFDFNEGGMTIKGAINPMLIPAGADLDGLTIPNKYIGGVVTEYKYLNCPVTSGTFSLEVESCGIEGQLRQRITYCHKTNSKTWERFSYGVDWGAWVLAADHAAETVAELRSDVEADLNTLGANLNSLGAELDAVANRIDNLSVQNFLWSGQNYMTATQTVNLSGKVSAQKNGIVLVFCEYINGAAATSAFHSFFIPKEQVATHPGKGYTFTLATGKFEYMATKYLYIDDEKIDGHADNNTTGTGTSGIKYTNNRFVLRYVIGI